MSITPTTPLLRQQHIRTDPLTAVSSSHKLLQPASVPILEEYRPRQVRIILPVRHVRLQRVIPREHRPCR